MLERLSAEVVESGREHPFVQALLRALEARKRELTDRLVLVAAQGGDVNAPTLFQLGARAAELAQVLGTVAEAGSKAND